MKADSEIIACKVRSGEGRILLDGLIKPPAVRSGDTIALISPASYETQDKYEAAVENLRQRGFKVKEGAHTRDRHGYFAGRDEDRIADFNRALKDSSVSVIIASRGGYGCSRILPKIDFGSVVENPRIILGGSDLTAVLWALHQRTGLVTFYGPMAVDMGRGLDEFTDESLRRVLTGRNTGEFPLPADHRPYAIKPGRNRGRLIGGCLSLVVSLLGTEYFGEVEGRILFLEEVGEKPFRIDRMLTHLRNAGVFNRISGLLLGDFYKCWEEDEEDVLTLRQIIEELLEGIDIPVLAGLPFGHNQRKMTLPYGVEVEIDAAEGHLIFLEEAVEVSA